MLYVPSHENEKSMATRPLALIADVINITDPLEYPEEATSYTHLWASFARGITIPETFIRIFDVLGCQIIHNYYPNMVLGYIVYRRVAAATAHHFNWDALNSLLITLAVF
jgi:hypothetical protein